MKTKKETPNYYSAVVVINSSGEVLLGKRKEDGIITTPAGGAEPGEENPVKTAVRELFEEAGIAADSRFLQLIKQRETKDGKTCHIYLHVVPAGVMTTSKLDPDQEVKTWKWYSMDKIPDALREDQNRFDSVMAGYMKFHGITKSISKKLTHSEECPCILFDETDSHCECGAIKKGGKPAAPGEVRNFGGQNFQKMSDGTWKKVVSKEEKQLENEQNNKVVSLTQKLKNKIADQKEILTSEKHLNDLKNQVVVENEETRSGKPVFTNIDSGLSHGYDAADFREVGNFFYDRAQKMADNIEKLKATGQEVDRNFPKIQKENLRISRAFISQANHIDDRHAKTKKMAKSTTMMAHQDAAEINTADFALENKLSLESKWLNIIQSAVDGYQYGDVPRAVSLDDGELFLVKVEDGMYSASYKKISPVPEGELADNAKVRMERMTLPTLVQFLIAKEWIKNEQPLPEESPSIEPMAQLSSSPIIDVVEPHPRNCLCPQCGISREDYRLKVLELLDKLLN